MSRRKRQYNRTLLPDERYQSLEVAKFINYIMQEGKKSVAQRIVYDAFSIIEDKTKKPPLEIFQWAMRNVAPMVEVRARRVGGANYQVPVEVRGNRRTTLAARWLIEASQNKQGKGMAQRLADELMQASRKEGNAMKKREDVHRMAEANRAFAHFA